MLLRFRSGPGQREEETPPRRRRNPSWRRDLQDAGMVVMLPYTGESANSDFTLCTEGERGDIAVSPGDLDNLGSRSILPLCRRVGHASLCSFVPWWVHLPRPQPWQRPCGRLPSARRRRGLRRDDGRGRRADANAQSLAYCLLMPNHFHLALWPREDGDLSRWMPWLMTTHVRRYLRHYRSSGHVWQGRFKAFPSQEDEHLLTVLRYIGATRCEPGWSSAPGPGGGRACVGSRPRSRHRCGWSRARCRGARSGWKASTRRPPPTSMWRPCGNRCVAIGPSGRRDGRGSPPERWAWSIACGARATENRGRVSRREEHS